MKYASLFFLLVFALFACDSTSSADTPIASDASVTSTPAKATSTTTTTTTTTTSSEEPALLTGDFNGDGEPDYLEIRTTDREDRGLGLERDLVVYSGAGNTRKNWFVAKSVLLPTEGGGIMGDPLVDVNIDGKTIVIKHFGGSRQKWEYVHRFRWQNGDFQLIGVTVHAGAPCDYFEDLDYNLSTGSAEYVKTTQDCSESEDNPIVSETLFNFVEKPTVRASMNGFRTGEYELKIPNMNEAVYF